MKAVQSRHGRFVISATVFGVTLLASLCVAEEAKSNPPGVRQKAATAPVAPGGETTGDRIGREGLYQAVSAMLITEAELVKASEEKDADPFQGAVQENEKTRQLMYSGLDDVLDEEFERAIPKLEAVIEADPTMLSVWSTLGWTYWKVDRQDDAIALWERLLALDSDNPVPHMLLGNAYVGTGQLKKGEMHLKQSIALDPKLVEPRLVLSSVYRWSGRHQASIKLLRELLAEAPDRLDIQNELALSLYFNGDYDDALPLLQQGVRADPDNRQLVTAHARCLLHTGNITEAEIRARRLLDEDKVDMDLLLLLADAPRYKNTPEDAVPYLEDIAWSAEDPIIKREALRRLVELYVRLWELDPEKYPLDKARRAARELVKMDPEFMPWQQELGELCLMDNNYIASEDMFKGVIANGNTNSLRAHVGLCETYQASKLFDKAVDEFEAIQLLDPKNPYHYNMLARLEMTRAGGWRRPTKPQTSWRRRVRAGPLRCCSIAVCRTATGRTACRCDVSVFTSWR